MLSFVSVFFDVGSICCEVGGQSDACVAAQYNRLSQEIGSRTVHLRLGSCSCHGAGRSYRQCMHARDTVLSAQLNAALRSL